MRLEDLLRQPGALPIAPALALYLVQTFDNDHADSDDVILQICADPLLTAKLLKQANSDLFGLPRPLSTVKEVLAALGLTRVRAMMLSAVLDRSFEDVPGVDLEQFWRYSFNTANLARYVALQVDVDLNVAFTVGMIHSIGELVMHVGMPDVMAQMDAATELLAIERAEIEFQAFGYTYADVGAALARSWRFPGSIVAAIAYQRAPFDNDLYEPMAGVIHMAAWRARAAELKQSRADLIHTYPDEIGELLRLDPDLLMDDFAGVLEIA